MPSTHKNAEGKGGRGRRKKKAVDKKKPMLTKVSRLFESSKQNTQTTAGRKNKLNEKEEEEDS